MDIWENTVLTDKGRVLQAKLLQGQTLKITRVTTGAKKVPIVDLRQQTDVTEGGYDITLQPSRAEGEKTILPVLLENTGLEESYDLWQVGFLQKIRMKVKYYFVFHRHLRRNIFLPRRKVRVILLHGIFILTLPTQHLLKYY